MFRSSLVFSSLIALTACTQPPAEIAMRGQEHFGRDGSHSVAYNTAAPVAPITTLPVSTGFTQSKFKEVALVQPTQSTAPLGSSIGVSDLEPAAGKPETQAAVDEPAPVNAWTNKPRDMAAPAHDAQYIWPVSSRDVTASFGGKGKGKVNDGINIAAGEGEPVWAAADGEVIYADGKMQGYGKMVIVKHAGGKTTTYAHLARYGVEKYDRVKQGDILGYVGSTGNVKTPQLYFSMRDGTKAIDPQKYLDRKVAGL